MIISVSIPKTIYIYNYIKLLYVCVCFEKHVSIRIGEVKRRMTEKELKGKMEVTISHVSRLQYDRIVSRIAFLCALHGKNYHTKFTPYKRVKE